MVSTWLLGSIVADFHDSRLVAQKDWQGASLDDLKTETLDKMRISQLWRGLLFPQASFTVLGFAHKVVENLFV